MKKILIIVLCFSLLGCEKEIVEKHVDLNSVNEINYSNVGSFEFPIHSNEYLVIRMSDFKVLFSKDADKLMYPASLTKLLTMDTVLNVVSDLDEKSYVSVSQVNDLIADDASLAYIQTDYEYTIKDLLYALILPSGADAAVALENYFDKLGLNLVEEMNKQAKDLGCLNSNFVNTTGLHNDNHYTCLNDLLKIVMDILTYDEGRRLLETTRYTMNDGTLLHTTIRLFSNDEINALGGKTGYTSESGQSIIVLFKKNNRSYLLMTGNAMGDISENQYWHFEDAMEIMNYLY